LRRETLSKFSFPLKYEFARIRFVSAIWTAHVDVTKFISSAQLYHNKVLIYLLTQTDFAMCHTASVMLYRRDAINLNEPNNYPFVTVCNRYVLLQYDVQIRLEWRELDCQQKQDALRKEAVFCSEIW